MLSHYPLVLFINTFKTDLARPHRCLERENRVGKKGRLPAWIGYNEKI